MDDIWGSYAVDQINTGFNDTQHQLACQSEVYFTIAKLFCPVAISNTQVYLLVPLLPLRFNFQSARSWQVH
jgi:hypothetical protein